MLVRLEPRFRPMVWGNPRLNELFGIETEPPVGEVWLLSDLEPFVTNVIGESNTSLREFLKELGMDLPRFPLLVKLVSPAQWLSIQVHPDDELARSMENEPWGKTECWYFVETGKIAVVLNGTVLEDCSDPSQIRRYLTHIDINPGDLFFVPAGLVHTLGPDSLVVEIQQTSDLTYRIDDWGRKRETHIEKALKAVKDFQLEELLHRNFERFECDHFTVYRVSGRTHLVGFWTVVFLKDGLVGEYKTKTFETLIVTDESIEGDALLIKIGK